MTENEKLKLVRERNRHIFEEIKKKVTPIQDTTPKTMESREQERKRNTTKSLKTSLVMNKKKVECRSIPPSVFIIHREEQCPKLQRMIPINF